MKGKKVSGAAYNGKGKPAAPNYREKNPYGPKPASYYKGDMKGCLNKLMK